MKYIKILLGIILLTTAVNAQIIPLFIEETEWLYALDLDGSTEYNSIASPTNLDLNGDERITLATDRTFEDSVGTYTDNGNHSISQSSDTANTGSYAGKIVNKPVATPTLVITEGSVTSGSIDSVAVADDKRLTLAETTGTPGFDYQFNYVIGSTDTPLQINFDGHYEGNPAHEILIQAYNGTTWIDLDTLVSRATDTTLTLPLGSSYLVTDSVMIRISHTDPGNVTHELYIDLLTLDYSTSGDSTTNYVSLPSTSFTPIVSGEKYTLQLYAYENYLDSDTLFAVIGSQSKAFTFSAASTWEKKVWSFQASSSEVGQDLKLYLNQADTVYVDDVSLTQAYDYLIESFVKYNYPTNTYESFFSLVGSGGINEQFLNLLHSNETSNIDVRFLVQDEQGADARIGGATITTNFQDATWYKIDVLIKRPDNDMIIYVDGDSVGAFAGKPNMGAVKDFTALEIGRQYETPFRSHTGEIGQIQVTRFGNVGTFTARTSISAWANGERSLYLDWKGNADTFLDDKSGTGNDLEGTNVTKDDVVKYKGVYK